MSTWEAQSLIHTPQIPEEGPRLPAVSHPFISLQPKDPETQITYCVLEQIMHSVILQGSRKKWTFEQWQLENPEASDSTNRGFSSWFPEPLKIRGLVHSTTCDQTFIVIHLLEAVEN